jgi:hypothetical protein
MKRIAAMFLGMFVCGSAHAQGITTHGSFPEKGDHIFVPTTFIPDAFVDTELAIGIGYSNSIATDIPLFTPGGQQIGTVEGDLLFMTGNLEFNCALRDWIGFFARFNALARSGSNTASIFASGLSAGSGFGMGWEFRLRETSSSMLSGSVAVDRTSITLIDVAAFVDDPDRGLSRTVTPLLGSLNVRYAYGVNDLVGFSAFGSVGAGENPRENYDDDVFWKLGGVASIDLYEYGAPIGLAGGLRTSSYPLTFDNADGNSWAALFTIAYMGRPDFSITLDTVYERVPLDYQDIAIGYIGFTAGLIYIF